MRDLSSVGEEPSSSVPAKKLKEEETSVKSAAQILSSPSKLNYSRKEQPKLASLVAYGSDDVS